MTRVELAAWLALYGAMSVAAFVAYGLDKRAARLGRWRIRERTLHALELLGGFPGAFVAQQVFRHKRRKGRFLAVFYAIVLLHGAFWAWRLRG